MTSNKHPEILGIVGIRSGSKGVSDKNIRELAGKPLVGWILVEAQKSEYLNRLVVSTNSEEYAEIARSFGAEVPYLRPEDLASDGAPEFEYVKHMLEWLDENEGYKPDIVVRMLATVPLQQTEDIDAVIKILIEDSQADSAVVIAAATQHPLKALKIVDTEDGERKLVTYFGDSGKEVTPIARQNYEKAYFRANVIAFKTHVINDTASLTGDIVRFHEIPQERAVDIDNEIDFFITEHLIQKLLG